jgi:hypothetical protein
MTIFAENNIITNIVNNKLLIFSDEAITYGEGAEFSRWQKIRFTFSLPVASAAVRIKSGKFLNSRIGLCLMYDAPSVYLD